MFEVDRHLAKVHWEMIARNVEDDVASDALSRSCAVARQLRTGYSPPPSVERHSSGPLRALVIGDPGDPRQEDDLPGARREALEVAELLRAYGVDVTVMVGAPSAPRTGAGASSRRWRDPRSRGPGARPARAGDQVEEPNGSKEGRAGRPPSYHLTLGFDSRQSSPNARDRAAALLMRRTKR